ncbi:MAG: hypothetical protein AAF495_05190 [Pseudomonadota bacterium]
MTRKAKSAGRSHAPGGGVTPDDHAFTSQSESYDRKTIQLCAQVQRMLAFLLETECGDESLQGFYVESVTPCPNAARLLVVLRQWDRRKTVDLGLVLRQLEARKASWRAQIGGAINRKRTPYLTFQVLLAGAVS